MLDFIKKYFKKPEPAPEPEPLPLHSCGHRAGSYVLVIKTQHRVCLSCYVKSYTIPRHQFSVK